jgi:hypothetical protein
MALKAVQTNIVCMATLMGENFELSQTLESVYIQHVSTKHNVQTK